MDSHAKAHWTMVHDDDDFVWHERIPGEGWPLWIGFEKTTGEVCTSITDQVHMSDIKQYWVNRHVFQWDELRVSMWIGLQLHMLCEILPRLGANGLPSTFLARRQLASGCCVVRSGRMTLAPGVVRRMKQLSMSLPVKIQGPRNSGRSHWKS